MVTRKKSKMLFDTLISLLASGLAPWYNRGWLRAEPDNRSKKGNWMAYYFNIAQIIIAVVLTLLILLQAKGSGFSGVEA